MSMALRLRLRLMQQARKKGWMERPWELEAGFGEGVWVFRRLEVDALYQQPQESC